MTARLVVSLLACSALVTSIGVARAQEVCEDDLDCDGVPNAIDTCPSDKNP